MTSEGKLKPSGYSHPEEAMRRSTINRVREMLSA